MEEPICHFVPYHQDYHSIHTINYVLEIEQQPYSLPKPQSVYKMHFVCSGKGYLHTEKHTHQLSFGDMFFTFPAVPFCIESEENFAYMYISFLGSRANMIMDNLKISPQNYLFHGCQEIYEFWKKGLKAHSDMTDLISESILLYSFFFLGEKIIPLIQKNHLNDDISLKIKKYIDDNFSKPKLTLDFISKELSYSPKYISSAFKKRFNLGIIEYLNIIRIQNACTMMQQGF